MASSSASRNRSEPTWLEDENRPMTAREKIDAFYRTIDRPRFNRVGVGDDRAYDPLPENQALGTCKGRSWPAILAAAEYGAGKDLAYKVRVPRAGDLRLSSAPSSITVGEEPFHADR